MEAVPSVLNLGCAGTAFTDPTHRHFFSRFSFDYFDSSHEFAFYSEARFRVVRSSLIFARSPLTRLVSRLANRYPRKYEARWGGCFRPGSCRWS